MKYTDRFLKALGAWQNGWGEDAARRINITNELNDSIHEMLPFKLPISNPIPTCYRKRFLVANNPQNGGDFSKLILDGKIDEGVASWTTSEGFGRDFKKLVRENALTAIFEHKPKYSEIIVDFNALWADHEFRTAVSEYKDRAGEYADALIHMGDNQSELILNSPLLSIEAIDFIGKAGDEDYFFNALGADTEEKKDIVWKGFVEIDAFPGDIKWTGRAGAQIAINNTKIKYEIKYYKFLYSVVSNEFLINTTHLTTINDINIMEYIARKNGIKI